MFKHNFAPIFIIHLNTATAVFKGNRKYREFFFNVWSNNPLEGYQLKYPFDYKPT